MYRYPVPATGTLSPWIAYTGSQLSIILWHLNLPPKPSPNPTLTLFLTPALTLTLNSASSSKNEENRSPDY